jgi:integrase
MPGRWQARHRPNTTSPAMGIWSRCYRTLSTSSRRLAIPTVSIGSGRPALHSRGRSHEGSNRPRYLTEAQLGQLIKAARKGRHGHRDATLILLTSRHGLRVTEAVDLRWDQVDFAKGHLHVKRLKGGPDSVHPIQGDELRALRELRREQEPQSAFVFTSERGGPMTRSNVAKMPAAAGDRAGLPHVHPMPCGTHAVTRSVFALSC